MAVVKKISELVPKGSALGVTDLLVVGVDNGTDYDLKSVTGAQLMSGSVSQTITDGDTTHSPSSNVVFDALALKVDKVTGSRLITSAESTLLGNTSGTNTGDQDLSGKVDKVVGKGLSTEDYTTAEKSKLAGLSGTNTGDQTLQQVTDKGSDTSNLISVTNNNSQGILSSSTIKSTNVLNGTWATIDSDGKIQIKTNIAGNCIIKATNISNDIILEAPNKTVGSYTIATTTDLTSKVDSNTAITGATKTKITYDSKGLVTSGADATTADIADSLNKRYVTDANLTVIGNTSGTNTGDQTFLNARVQSVTSSATVTPLSTNDEIIITAQAVGLTLANPTGTFTEGQAFIVRIKDNGTAQSIAYGTNYRGTTLPTTTTVGTTTYIPFIYNSTDGKYDNLSASGITTTIPAVIQLACSDETTALTVGTSKVTFRMPHAMTLTSVRASLNVAGTTSGITTIDINEGGNSILSTKLTIDLTEKTSTTAVTPSVISDTSLADDSEITIDIDAISGGATEKGLKISLIGTRTI